MPVSDAVRERQDLCIEALAKGPDAPTMCEGWTVRDLLVHLFVRDSRPDVALGRLLPPLQERSARVEAELGALPFEKLVDRVRSGRPRWHPTTLTAVDNAMNRAEFFVHHEDIRRAGPGAAPRDLPQAESAALWKNITLMGRLFYRTSPTGVVLVTPQGPRAVVKRAPVAVSIVGEPQELLLHAFGRRSVAQVRVDGSPEAVREFASAYPS